MTIKPLLLLLLPLLTKAWQTDHVLLIWEHTDFSGEEGYVDAFDHKCVPLVPSWRDRISSVNTNGQCYELYKEEDCSGKPAYVYPTSKSHNNLEVFGVNDNIRSVRLCLLDEIALDKSLQPMKQELPFWDFVFDCAYLYKKDFRSRSSNATAISWDFLPNVSKNGSLAEQYQDALDWMLRTFKRQRAFGLSDLVRMRKMAYKIFDDRANRNAARRPTPVLGSKEDAIHFQLEVYWKKIVEAIDDEIERIETEKESKRRKSQKQNIKAKG